MLGKYFFVLFTPLAFFVFVLIAFLCFEKYV